MKRLLPSLLLFILALQPAAAYTNDPLTSEEVQRLIGQIRKSFVFFDQGSGVVISGDGLLLTNSHVLLGDQEVYTVRLGTGASHKAKLLGKDPFGDLALLQIEGVTALPHLPIGKHQDLKPGQICLALGNPFAIGLIDQEPTVTLGVISGLHQFHGRYTDAIVTDVPINPGNSGGPLINLRGELIGINGMIRPSLGLRSNTGLAYAIPPNQLKLWIPRLKESGGEPVYHGLIGGLSFHNDTKVDVIGAKILEVREGSGAEQLGFKADDIITQVNEFSVWNPQRFFGIIGTYPAGSKMRIRLKRAGSDHEMEFDLPENRPGQLRFKVAEPRRKQKYLEISEVEKDSNADKAGLKAGDQILAIQGQTMDQAPAFQYLLLENWRVSLPRNSRVQLLVRRRKGRRWIEKAITFIAD